MKHTERPGGNGCLSPDTLLATSPGCVPVGSFISKHAMASSCGLIFRGLHSEEGAMETGLAGLHYTGFDPPAPPPCI